MAATASTFWVPGARLYCELRGSGPVLLLIPGGNGDAVPFEPTADALADRYTVVNYDRRGFSRSRLDGPLPQRRIEADCDDAHHPNAVLADQLGSTVAHFRAAMSAT